MDHIDESDIVPGTEVMRDHDGLHFQRGGSGMGPV